MYELLVFIGNVGRDPEMRYTPSGQAVTNFSVAVNRSYTNSRGEKVEQTKWFRVATWGKLAESCNLHVFKGQRLLVEGRLEADESGSPKIWTDGDGNSRASFDVTAHNVRFLTFRDGDGGEAGEEAEEVTANF